MALRISEVALVAVGQPLEGEQLCRQLASCGWHALSVDDGAAALAALQSRPVTLAVVGVDLPRMRGTEVITSARAAGWRGHVVFIDSSERADVRQQCLDIGARAYLAGPLSAQSLAEFLQVVRRLQTAASTGTAETTEPYEGLEPGTRVHLCVQSGPAVGGYPAVVTDASPASLNVMTHPDRDEARYMSLGTVVRVGFPSARGWGEFTSQISGCYTRGALTEIALSLPSHVVYRQRRRWPRGQLMLPVRAWPTTHPDRAGVMVAGHTDDISQAGLSASLHAPLPVAEFVTLAVDVDGNELRVIARAIWCQPPTEPSSPVVHRYGFQFAHLGRGARTRIRALLEQAASVAPHPPAPGARRVPLPLNGLAPTERPAHWSCDADLSES